MRQYTNRTYKILATTIITDIAPKIIISRSDAIRAGLIMYRTGKKCSHGHTDWRYTETDKCVTCSRINSKKHYDRVTDRLKRWRNSFRLNKF